MQLHAIYFSVQTSLLYPLISHAEILKLDSKSLYDVNWVHFYEGSKAC